MLTTDLFDWRDQSFFHPPEDVFEKEIYMLKVLAGATLYVFRP